jgi:hypothetical protein
LSFASGIGVNWLKETKYGSVSKRFSRWKTMVLSSVASTPFQFLSPL